ncbi:MAG: hypothetical protein ACFB21_03710 [Opitutales bacterium]
MTLLVAALVELRKIELQKRFADDFADASNAELGALHLEEFVGFGVEFKRHRSGKSVRVCGSCYRHR